MRPYILDFQQANKTKLAMVGGKGANLGELTGIKGLQVPEGFCVTTQAYKEVIGNSAAYNSLLNELSVLKAGIGKLLLKSAQKFGK